MYHDVRESFPEVRGPWSRLEEIKMSKMTHGVPVAGPSPERGMFERREFLKLGSVALVTLAAGDAFAETLRPGVGSGLPAQLAVAYAGASDLERADGASVALQSAGSALIGDSRFLSKTAKVKVLGMWRPEGRRDPLTVALKAYYPTSRSAGGDVPVYAWSQTNGALRRQSTFRIPVDDAGLRIELESSASTRPSVLDGVRRRFGASDDAAVEPRDRAAIAALPNVAALSLGIEQGSAKLNRGTYVFALLPEGAKAPDWQSIRFTPRNMKSDGGPVSAVNLFGESPVSFDYVVLDVDYA
jgi:hypothetical protein